METLWSVTQIYLIVLILALLIERIMEVLMEVWNYLEWKAGLNELWNRRAEALRDKFERKARAQVLGQRLDVSGLIYQLRHVILSHKEGHSGAIPIISADQIRQVVVSTSARVMASLLGIALCLAAGVNLVRILEIDFLQSWPGFIQVALSGVVIGLGAEPVHNIISSVEKRRQDRAKRAELEKRLSGSA